MIRTSDLPVYETGAEPEFYANNIRIEIAGSGNLRVFVYALRNGILHLLYTVIVPADDLAAMGRYCLVAAAASNRHETVPEPVMNGRAH